MSAPDRIWVRGNESAVAWQGKVDRDGFDPRIAGCVEYLRANPARLHAEELAETLRETTRQLCRNLGWVYDPSWDAVRKAQAALAKMEKEEESDA